MILIADSGSTKTTWCLLKGQNQPQYFHTEGLNPFFRTSEEVFEELNKKLLPFTGSFSGAVFFYGAGIVNAEKGDVIKKPLEVLFPGSKIYTESDLLASARATLASRSGIACILGTGSNSCLYDGNSIVKQVSPLGFILGDEGSGAVLGRKLVGDYLKNQMPETLKIQFSEKYPLQYADFLDRVYRKEKPNRFLASFVPFLNEHIGTEYCQNLMVSSFNEFITRNIKQYAGFESLPICFTGSVALHFKNLLALALNQHGLKYDVVVKEPIDGLADYHQQG